MADVARIEVVQQVRQNDPPRDFVSNTLWFQTQGAPTTTDFHDLAQAISTLFSKQAAIPAWGMFNGRGITTKVYSMNDPEPRPVQAQVVYTPSFWASGDLTPRQIALCLSFYGDRNIKRQRGRIYVGPLDTLVTGKERPGLATMQAIAALGQGLFQAGTSLGTPWVHGVWSAAGSTFTPASHYWCNDVYDTVRRRVPKETARVRYP